MSVKALSSGALINFFPGHPTPRLLPREEILEASNRVLFPSSDSVVNYETYNDPVQRDPLTYASDEGALWVRTAVADWVNKKFSLKDKQLTKPGHINLTSGASYGVANILLQTTAPGYTRHAFIVTPCYYLINDCFIDAGFKGKISAVKETKDGQLDLDTIEAFLAEDSKLIDADDEKILQAFNGAPRAKKKTYRYVFWCVPTFSNPSGITITLETREKLIQLARKYDMLIITDDVYDTLVYTDTVPPPRFDAIDRMLADPSLYGNTVSNASFSKIIAPGLRIGWQTTATEKLAYQISQGGANTSGGLPGHFNSTIAGNMILTGSIDNVIRRFSQVYSERAKAVRETVDKYFPKGYSLTGGEGGYFMWLLMPLGVDCKELCRLSQEKGVKLANGDYFEVDGNPQNWGTTSVRLSISYLEKEDIIKGLRTVGEIASSLIQN